MLSNNALYNDTVNLFRPKEELVRTVDKEGPMLCFIFCGITAKLIALCAVDLM